MSLSPKDLYGKKRENYETVEKEKKSGSILLSGYPYWLTIDPSSRCSLRCPLCPTGQRRGTRPAVNMSMDRFRKVIDSLGPWLIHMDMCNWGEPLMNESIFDMVSYAKRYLIHIKIDTNMTVLSDESAEKLVSSGLDRVILSVDGVTQETYGIYRKGGDIKKVFDNIRLLAEKRAEVSSDKPFLEWQFLVFRHNQHEIERAREIAPELGVDRVSFTPPYAGSEEWLSTLKPFRDKYYDTTEGNISFRRQSGREICSWLWDGVTVNSDGSVSPCCSVEEAPDDFAEEFPDGDFREFFNTKKYIDARRRILERNPPEPSSSNVCLRCEHWGWSNHADLGHLLREIYVPGKEASEG